MSNNNKSLEDDIISDESDNFDIDNFNLDSIELSEITQNNENNDFEFVSEAEKKKREEKKKNIENKGVLGLVPLTEDDIEPISFDFKDEDKEEVKQSISLDDISDLRPIDIDISNFGKDSQQDFLEEEDSYNINIDDDLIDVEYDKKEHTNLNNDDLNDDISDLKPIIQNDKKINLQTPLEDKVSKTEKLDLDKGKKEEHKNVQIFKKLNLDFLNEKDGEDVIVSTKTVNRVKGAVNKLINSNSRVKNKLKDMEGTIKITLEKKINEWIEENLARMVEEIVERKIDDMI